MSMCNWFGYLVIGSLYVVFMSVAVLIIWALYKAIKEG
jgi:hypothetical protein